MLFLAVIFAAGCSDNDTGQTGEDEFITDANFYKLCLEQYDANGDGVFTREEAALVTELILHNQRISSLEGIGYFTRLEYLDCSENFISEIDMSSLPGLKVLNANFNPLTKVDVTANPLLEQLWCSPRDDDKSKLRAVDVSNNPLLRSLNVFRLGLKTLDITNNPHLTELYVSENELGTLDVSHCTALVELQASGAGLTMLKLPASGTLQRVGIQFNSLTHIDLTGQRSLASFYCDGNKVGVIEGVTDCTGMVTFSCSGCELERLDVTGLTSLRQLYCGDNALSTLDLSTNHNLSGLYASGNNGLQVTISQTVFDNLTTDLEKSTPPFIIKP